MATVIRATCDVPRACERAHVARGVGLVDARNRRLAIRIQPFEMLKPDVRATFWHKKNNREEDSRRCRRSGEAAAADGRGRCRACRADQLREPRRDGVHGRVQRLDDSLRGGGPLAIDPLRIGAPWYTADVAGETRRIIDAGAKAFKVHPPHQTFRANACPPRDAVARGSVSRGRGGSDSGDDSRNGTSVFPGARSRLGDPMDVDDVAVDFPRLKILLAHGGRPLWIGGFLRRSAPSQRLPRGLWHPAGEVAGVLSTARGDRAQDGLGCGLAKPWGEIDAPERGAVPGAATWRRGETADTV